MNSDGGRKDEEKCIHEIRLQSKIQQKMKNETKLLYFSGMSAIWKYCCRFIIQIYDSCEFNNKHCLRSSIIRPPCLYCYVLNGRVLAVRDLRFDWELNRENARLSLAGLTIAALAASATSDLHIVFTSLAIGLAHAKALVRTNSSLSQMPL